MPWDRWGLITLRSQGIRKGNRKSVSSPLPFLKTRGFVCRMHARNLEECPKRFRRNLKEVVILAETLGGEARKMLFNDNCYELLYSCAAAASKIQVK